MGLLWTLFLLIHTAPPCFIVGVRYRSLLPATYVHHVPECIVHSVLYSLGNATAYQGTKHFNVSVPYMNACVPGMDSPPHWLSSYTTTPLNTCIRVANTGHRHRATIRLAARTILLATLMGAMVALVKAKAALATLLVVFAVPFIVVA